jgi:hypothetical protein
LISDLQSLIPAATEPFIAEVLQLYPAEDYEDIFDRRQTILGDMYVNCPSAWIAQASFNRTGNWKLIFHAGTELHGATAEYLFDPNYESKSTI